MIEELGFYVFGAAVIYFFAAAVISTNVLYAISCLAAGMVLLSAHYFLLGADFLGAAQIIVYSGAVLALLGFAMMFFDLSRPLAESRSLYQLCAAGGVALFGLVMTLLLLPRSFRTAASDLPLAKQLDNTQQLGAVLFSKYLLAFELVALVLLIALVAALMLIAKKERA